MNPSAVHQLKKFVVVTTEHGSCYEHLIEPGRSLFAGASSHCGIQIIGKDIAKMHCLFDQDDGVISVQDWASPSGTFVNGSQIDTKTALCENDQVKIGNVTIAVRGAQRTESVHNPSECPTVTSKEPSDHDAAIQGLASDPEFDDHGETADRLDLQIAGLKRTIATVDKIDEAQDDEIETILDAEIKQVVVDESDDQIETLDDSPWHVDPDTSSATTSTYDEPMLYDQETIDLLRAEIDDLRSMLVQRDNQIEEHAPCDDTHSLASSDIDHAPDALQRRVDELLAEAAENDERFTIVHDLMEAAEIKNQAESEERQALESWVGEIEHRIGQRESEWKAQLGSTNQRLQATAQERDTLQHQLRDVASRFGAQDVYRETLDNLQSQNAQLQDDFATARKDCAGLKQQLDNIRDRESEAIQQERALIAKDRANVSRLRFELSRKLAEVERLTESKNDPDSEVSLRMQTLRSHLKEIHEQEQSERGEKSDNLFARISGLWKRMDYEY